MVMVLHSDKVVFKGDYAIFPSGRKLLRVRGAESQGGAPAGVQPPAGGQGDPGDGGTAQNDGFWGNFPNIPEDMRPQLEPHLKEVQSYITKMEQQYAPIKDIDPEAMQGLVNLDAQFSRDPRGTWLQMGQRMQEQGLLHDDLDFEAISAVAQGIDPDAGQEPQTQNGTGLQGLEGLPEPIQQLLQQQAQTIEELRGQVQEIGQGVQQDRVSQRQQAEDRAFRQMRDEVREYATSQGWPEDLLTDQELTAKFITHGGDAEKVKASFASTREGLLKTFANNRNGSENELEMPNGAPPSPDRKQTGRRDAFTDARRGAATFLERAAQQSAQGG